ncbi:MAG: hypothetical protein ACOYXY_01045 [Thermodesulfobacteriota bacterium]
MKTNQMFAQMDQQAQDNIREAIAASVLDKTDSGFLGEAHDALNMADCGVADCQLLVNMLDDIFHEIGLPFEDRTREPYYHQRRQLWGVLTALKLRLDKLETEIAIAMSAPSKWVSVPMLTLKDMKNCPTVAELEKAANKPSLKDVLPRKYGTKGPEKPN